MRKSIEYRLIRVVDGKAQRGMCATLSAPQMTWLLSALRLRVEACQENDEKRTAGVWNRIYRAVAFVLEWKD